MGRALLDHRIKVTREGLITNRSGSTQIGEVESVRSGWVSSCDSCGTHYIRDTRATAANDLWDHWSAEHP